MGRRAGSGRKQNEKGFEIANQVYEKIEDKSSLLLPVEMYLSPFDFNQK